MQEIKSLRISEIVHSVSITHKFEQSHLYAINTGDIEDGSILNCTYTPTEDLKGQFKKTIQNGDILFSEIRPANRRFAKVEGLNNPMDYVVSTKLMVLRKFNDLVDADYFYYCLTNQSFLNVLQMRAENRIGSFPQITFELLSEYSFPIPSLEEQRQIVHVLSTIDDKIANNNAICAELEAMAKLLYDYWFVQFDFPDENGKPYKSSGGKMVWSEELKREIPEGWEVGCVSDLGSIVTGSTPPTEHKEYFTDHGFAWATPKDLSLLNGRYFFGGAVDLTEAGLKNSSGRLMPAGSILFTTRAPIGYIAITANPACTNQGFKSIVPDKKFGTEFVFQTLRNLTPQMQRVGVGSTFKEVSKEVFSAQPVVLPAHQVVLAFSEMTTDVQEMLKRYQEENAELASLREFLLPLLMNGQVTFKEADCH